MWRCLLGKPTIRAIFCDHGNVVLRFCGCCERLWQMAKLANPDRFGHPALPDLTSERPAFLNRLELLGVLDFSQAGQGAAWKLDTGKVNQRDFYAAFLAATDSNSDTFPPERFWSAYTADMVAIPEICALLKELRSQGVALIAATNGHRWSADSVYQQTGLAFDSVVMSWQIGHKKPAEEFFAVCLGNARRITGDHALPYSACLLIDDIGGYYKSFRLLGGDAIQFKASQEPPTLALQMSPLRSQLRLRHLLE